LAAVDATADGARFGAVHEAEQALHRAHGASARFRHPQYPTEWLRALLLESVFLAADQGGEQIEKSARVRNVAWYSLRNALVLGSADRWAPVLREIAHTWGERVEKQLASAWTPKGEYVVKLTSPSATTTPAPYGTPSANVKDVTALRDGLMHLQRVQSWDRLRLDLLWWRLSRHSPRAQARYDELGAAEVAVLAAIDLHERAPGLAPASIEHLLADVVAEAATGEVTLADLRAAGAPHLTTFAQHMPAQSPAPLLTLIAGRDHSQETVPGLHKPLPVARASLVLFRDLQMADLLSRSTA
jgi:hypothetical protein